MADFMIMRYQHPCESEQICQLSQLKYAYCAVLLYTQVAKPNLIVSKTKEQGICQQNNRGFYQWKQVY